MTIKYFHECLVIHWWFLGIFSDLGPSQYRSNAHFKFLSIIRLIKKLSRMWLFECDWNVYILWLEYEFINFCVLWASQNLSNMLIYFHSKNMTFLKSLSFYWFHIRDVSRFLSASYQLPPVWQEKFSELRGSKPIFHHDDQHLIPRENDYDKFVRHIKGCMRRTGTGTLGKCSEHDRTQEWP